MAIIPKPIGGTYDGRPFEIYDIVEIERFPELSKLYIQQYYLEIQFLDTMQTRIVSSDGEKIKWNTVTNL